MLQVRIFGRGKSRLGVVSKGHGFREPALGLPKVALKDRREAPHLTAVGLSTGEAEATTRQLIASPCTDLASGDVLKLNSMRALACWQQLMCVGLDFRRFR